jgi:N-acetylglucosamine PTS system EIICBA or EIICB component
MRAFLARGGVTVERVSTVEPPASVVKMPPTLHDGKAVLAALGGAANVRDVSVCSSRLRVGVARSEAVDEAALKASGARGVVKLGSSVHVVIGPAAAQLADALRMALA